MNRQELEEEIELVKRDRAEVFAELKEYMTNPVVNSILLYADIINRFEWLDDMVHGLERELKK